MTRHDTATESSARIGTAVASEYVLQACDIVRSFRRLDRAPAGPGLRARPMRKRDRRRLDPAHGVLTYPAGERRAVPPGLAGRADDRAAARRYPGADDRRRHERLGGRDRAGPHLPREQLPWRCRDHADRGVLPQRRHQVAAIRLRADLRKPRDRRLHARGHRDRQPERAQAAVQPAPADRRLGLLRQVVALETSVPLAASALLATGAGLLAAFLYLRSQLGYALQWPGAAPGNRLLAGKALIAISLGRRNRTPYNRCTGISATRACGLSRTRSRGANARGRRTACRARLAFRLVRGDAAAPRSRADSAEREMTWQPPS
jgi:hypothetical protein